MNTSSDVESPLPDLNEFDLALLRLAEDSVLRRALQRIEETAANGEHVVAGFNSSI